MTMTKVLLSIDSASFTGGLLDQVCQHHGVPLGDLVIVSSLQELSKQQLPGDGAYDAVLSLSASAAAHSLETLSTLVALAKPGATVVVQEVVAARPSKGVSTAEKLQQLMLLAGLSEGVASPEYSLGALPAFGSREGISPTAVQARKPSWARGTQHPIRRKLGGKAAGTAVKLPPADAAAVWSAAALGDGADLMDDEELLTEEDRARPEVPVADCSTSRKACKDCTCGRAEDEAAGAPPPQLTKEMLENPGAEGGCGSCALGDAFRCASCPYRGLPTFQKGKKIELPTSFLAEDF